MSEQPRQVSRAVLGFPRGRRVRRALAAVALLAAVASLAPPWWRQAAVAADVGVVLWDVLGQPTDRPQAPGAPLAPTWGVQERLDAVKVVLTVVGGVGAVVALTVAYRRQRLTEADSHREDTRVVLDRYTKAAELLARQPYGTAPTPGRTTPVRSARCGSPSSGSSATTCTWPTTTRAVGAATTSPA